MSISPRSTCWWSSALAIVGVLTLAAAQPPQNTEKVPPFLEEFQPGKLRDLTPFLDDYYSRTDPPVVDEEVWIKGEGADRGGLRRDFMAYWARPKRKDPLPAVVLAYDDAKLAGWMPAVAIELATIGYAVLAVDLQHKPIIGDLEHLADEEPQRRLSDCMRWLRCRAEVLPNRLGVIGFGVSGRQALLFASSRQIQACVICDAATTLTDAERRGLRGTPVLVVHGDDHALNGFASLLNKERITQKIHAAKSKAGFLGPPGSKTYNHDAAEDAWVAIYNFLEKHVEDAKPAETVARPAKSALTISDMMRAVNDPSGVRGTLSKALETQPKTARQWSQVRAHAALIAELGTWLQAQTPPKGPAGHWQEQAQAFSAAAAAIVDAAERRDHALAQRRLADLAGKCAACHNVHR